MRKSSKLPDAFYDSEIERLSGLAKFPALPMAQKEIRRALRHISESDGGFITSLITQVVDSNAVCPSPAELIRRAGEIRHRAHASIGNPDCEFCHGSGWIQFVRRVSPPNVAPYDAEASKPCPCQRGRAV